MSIVDYVHARCHEIGECWEWTGATQVRSRVPVMRYKGNSWPVRRVLAEVLGHQLDGRVATFRCGNQLCCNPQHLWITSKGHLQRRTNATSVRYMHPTRRARVAAARRVGSKLSPELVAEIRRDDRTQRLIAAAYGISQTTVSRIKRGQMWRDYSTPFSLLVGLAA